VKRFEGEDGSGLDTYLEWRGTMTACMVAMELQVEKKNEIK